MRINWYLLSGLLLASISLTFSAHGLVTLFSGAGAAIVAMAIALELGKVMGAIYLIQNFRWRPLPIALLIATLCLILISTTGIYGFLGKAYGEGRKAAVVSAQEATSLEREIEALSAQREQKYALISTIPGTHGTNRLRMLAEVQPAIERLDSLILRKQEALAIAKRRQVSEAHDIGQLKYAAEMLGMTDDELARFLITGLALLLDPLAVLLVIASGAHGRREEAEEEEENTAVQESSSQKSVARPEDMEARVFGRDVPFPSRSNPNVTSGGQNAGNGHSEAAANHGRAKRSIHRTGRRDPGSVDGGPSP